MQCKKMLAVIGLGLTLSPLSLAQSQLKLPSGDDDYRELVEDKHVGPCERCGVVSGIRTQTHAAPPPRNPAPPTAPSLVTTPIIGTGSVVEDARSANAPVTTYVVTVRYDDGSYGFIEQHDEPVVGKGDRVRVSEGRVELRQDQVSLRR